MSSSRSDGRLWRDRPVAVTGATGFVGSHLVDRLVTAGARVTVVARRGVPSTPIADRWRRQVRVVRGRVEDQATMERLLGDDGIRTVFHLAAQSQVGAATQDPTGTFASNIGGTWSLLEAARHSPAVAQVVLASSVKVYGAQGDQVMTEEMSLRATNPYDVSKACGDLLARSYAETYGVPVCVTRCGNFFGPGDVNWDRIVPGTCRAVLAGRAPAIRSDGTMERDYLHVADGTLATMRLAEVMAEDPAVHGEAFNFSTETPVSVLDLVAMVQDAAGTCLEPEVAGTATGEIDRQRLSADKARRLLGWKPSMSLEAAMADTVSWYRAHLAPGSAAG